ncbi:MAG: histidine kinase [Candidatus Rokuibacteriota bacterium]|nr:MAG: histidine kinase [Candidatus Rokubacteria bacterium]
MSAVEGPDGDRVDILVVDDMPGQRMAVESVLAELGENVVAVESGREALRYLLDHDVAVILLDVNMPEMDGFETAALVRQRPRTRNVPIIFLTADTDELHAARGYSLGAVDYLFSPFLPEILRTKVKVFVELARMHVQARRHAEERVALATEQAARAAAEANNVRLGVLAEATRVLSRPLESASVAGDLLRAVLPYMADLAGVLLVDAARSSEAEGVWLRVDAEGRLGPPPAGTPALREILDAALRVIASHKLEPLPSKDGSGTWAIVAPLPARSATLGAMAFAMLDSGRRYATADLELVRDLASRTAISLDNRSLYREIEERDRRKDEFLAMLAHELRNPLAAITNAVTVLERLGDRTDDTARIRMIIGRQTHHLARLVDDLLDVARVTTGRIVVERRPVALAEVARRALQAFEAAGKTAQHEVVLKTDPVWVIGDASRLEQVVANLLDNALRYTARGGRVMVSVQPDRSEAVLRVRDTGRGIPSALLPQIFDLFVRGGGVGHARADGLGLGLTLVRRLVELHGGSVEALSAGEGLGSELIVRLPASAEPSASTRPAASSTLRPTRILIVEDNDDARESLRLLLELDGHEVKAAVSGEDGLALAECDDFTIALVDLGLPGIDGFEVARKLRATARGAEMRLVAISGYGQPLDRKRAQAAGFDAHLVKPVDTDYLRTVLAELAPA